MIKSINPFDNTELKSFTPDSEFEINNKIQRAEESYRNWRNTSFEERKKLLVNLADQLLDKKEEYAKLMILEMGKVKKEAIGEVEKCALVCKYYAEKGAKLLDDELIDSDASKSFISYEPLGVILAVMPWNFPFWQVFRFAAPAIMAGNSVLLKHASNVPQCALAIENIFKDVDFPKNLFQTLLIESNQVEKVIENSIVKAVTLTGSELAGSKVAETSGRNIKKTVLELGGSDAFIVLDDANLDEATDVAVKSRFMNCGQSCIAAKRFIVSEKVYEQFLGLFKNKVEALKYGNPISDEVDYASMARQDLAIDLENQVKKSVDLGARVVCGGNRDRASFEPTILTEVKQGMPAYSEELFGPVAAVIKVKDIDEAIEIANDSDFGLGGSVWTENYEKGLRVAKSVETGAMFVNGLVKSDPRLPFGGIKISGYGRELAHLGIREFTNQKTIWMK